MTEFSYLQELTLKIMTVESLLSNLVSALVFVFILKAFFKLFQSVIGASWATEKMHLNVKSFYKLYYHPNSLKSMLLVWYLSTNSTFFFFLRYSPKTPALVSETVYYKRGVSQQFTLPSFKIDFSEWKEEDVSTVSLV